MNNQFYKMMCDVFYVYLKNFYQIKLNNKKISPTKLDGKVSENITNDKFYKKTQKSFQDNKNPFRFFKKSKYKNIIKEKLNLLIKELKDSYYKEKLTNSSIKFVEEKLYKIFTSESKLYKNDILDLLITISLEVNLYKLVSLDKKFITIIKEIDSKSFELIEKLGLKA